MHAFPQIPTLLIRRQSLRHRLKTTRQWPLLLIVASAVNFSAGAATNDWIQLFNGRSFDGFDRFLAPPPGSKEPLGLNNDPRGVFTITNIDNRGAIHVSGELYGAVTTHVVFTNAHIRVEYKWGEKKWPP